MRTILLTILVVSVISCKKDKESNGSFADGTYIGTFQRQIAGGGKIVDVTLNLNTGGYDGIHQSNIYERYPVIGLGTYSTSGDKITFVDSLAYTADFDWTLILANEYNYSANGDSLTIFRQYGNLKDIYKLKKQKK